ncbi:uncharacterized protein [Diadema antillarum]|uniref:uncharacterized protein n=1 Tax=Diadema antillarum TaxID=105358 RepID=UPI003A87A67D
MGRKLNLSHLSDGECRQILDVIQRDFRVRHNEKERITDLQKYVYEEAQKRMVLSRQQKFNEKHCICCFSSFGFILNRKTQCRVCQFFICKNCRAKAENKDDTICIACIQQQELQVRACEWFYAQIRARYKRFGSAKVVRSLYKRDRDRGSGSEDEDSQNSDSGVDRQRSPTSFGSGFDLSSLIHGPRSDQETNTDDDWLTLLRPAMTSVGVQAPQDKTNEGADMMLYNAMEEMIQATETGAERSKCSRYTYHEKVIVVANDRVYAVNGTEISQHLILFQGNLSEKDSSESPSLVVYDPHGDKVSKNSESSGQKTPPPVANGRQGDAMLYHVLSPIEEMSSPECSDKGSSSKPGSPAVISDGSKLEDIKGRHGDANTRCTMEPEVEQEGDGEEEDEVSISPRELDSGIHLAFSSSTDGDALPCPDALEADKMLSQRLKMQNIGCSDSFESVASASLSLPSLDANDTLDSLETHIHSSHSDLHSPPPDIHEDFDSTNSTLVGKTENAEEEWKGAEQNEKAILSRSSSEETLKSDEEGEEGIGGRELSMEEFLDQIHTRTSSMTEEGYEDEERRRLEDDNFEDSKDTFANEEESENRDHVSLNLDFHPRSFYKRSRSSDDFRAMRDVDQSEDPGSNSDGEESKAKTKSQSGSRGKFSSNRFIRYDSLPLVVEVYEADSNSPSFSPIEFNRSRFIYDSGQDSESANESKDSPKRQAPSHAKTGKRPHTKNGHSTGNSRQSRQTSVESSTTESTLPKSTPISSGPTTPDSDRKRQDSHATISSESEYSPDAVRKDRILFTKQLLQKQMEYYQQQARESRRMQGLADDIMDEDSSPYRSRNRSTTGVLQKQSSLPSHSSIHEDKEIPTGYRRLSHHGTLPSYYDSSALGQDSYNTEEQHGYEDDERDDSCVCNSDEIVGLLSEQDMFDNSDDEEEEEEFEDANTTLTDDLNGNSDSNHNDDILQSTGGCGYGGRTEVDENETQGDERGMSDQKEEMMETDLSEKSEVRSLDAAASSVCDFRSHGDATDEDVGVNALNNEDDDDGDDYDVDCSEILPTDGCHSDAHPSNDEELRDRDDDLDSRDAAEDGAEEDADDKEDDSKASQMLQRKTEADLTNLTQKLSIKQGEVLQSAEEVLSSATQLSIIQNEVDALDNILTSLERKVAKGILSSQTSSEYEESDGGDFDVNPQELVEEDLCELEVQLAQTEDDNPHSQINMASAVRMITATALKVLNTTEAAIESQQDLELEQAALCSDIHRHHFPEEEDEEEDHHGNEPLTDYGVQEGNQEPELIVDRDNNVFQNDLERFGDFPVGVERDKNANAIEASPKILPAHGDGTDKSAGRRMTPSKVVKERQPDELSFEGVGMVKGEREPSLASDVGKEIATCDGEKRSTPKNSLRLTLPSKKANDDKRKETGGSASPNSASTKPKSPEATVSPGSRHSGSPSSGPILHLTSGSTSPPTATLLFSSDDSVWECSDRGSVPPSSSDSDSILPVETAPDEGKDSKDVSREDTYGISVSPAKKPKSAEVSVFECPYISCNGENDLSPDFLSAFYDRVSELEERVYLSAGKVFTLEERLHQLELEVNSVDCTLPDDIMAVLEDKVALTVAQVQQCEREVNTVEDNVTSLDHTQDHIFSTMYSVDHIPTTPRKLENISSASFLLNHPDNDEDDVHGHSSPPEVTDKRSTQTVEVMH